MAENKDKKVLNVPNIRFKEFEEEWEECRLGEIGKLYKGVGISKDQLSDNGEPCILYGELYTKYKSEVINEVISKTNISDNKLVRSNANDVIIPCSGETAEDIATARCVLNDNVLLGGDLNIIRLHKDNGLFMSYQLNGKRKYDIARVSQGVSVVHLYGEHLKGIKTYCPNLDEQNKIATFLSLLDERIATQNKIIDKLESLIKGICNNYFLKLSHSQEMKSIRLGDILKERNEYCCKDGTFVHGTLSKDGLFPKTERWNRDFLVKEENKKYKITHLDDICYNPANLKFGVICRNIYGDLIFSPIYVTFEVSKKVNIGFIELYLTNRNFIEKIRKFEQGTVYERMSVSPEDFLSYKIRIPSLSEQTFFYQKIQRLKNCSQNELEHLNLYKKLRQYLLRQMFI
ncbi:restriction endonuclease subunit S [Prevotella nigrescens]|uniref:restriction endonuclease subunit S n=1 Tax=Prevotella nigrescens TaxID=28133 RepID=UPI001C5E9857|nr:restriction endonuclease subunit S [Prevotella nigrescens]MBW4727480.1 restriction endonuclease subunit S [Prevotella nigrescens]